MERLRRSWTIVWKDLLIEARTKQAFNAMVFFAALVLFIFSFALGPDTELLQQVSGGLLWVGIAFTGILSLNRTYQSEETSGGIEGLRVYPGDPRAIYLGKLFGNIIILLAVEMVLFPAAAVLFQIQLLPHAFELAQVALLGTIGFSIVGTFYAALTVNLRAREVMLPLLLFPAIIPMLLGAVNATTLIVVGDPMLDSGLWIRLLVAFDIIFFVISIWVFPIALEE